MIIRQCRAQSSHIRFPSARSFSSTRIYRDDPPNHYETLGLTPQASGGEIKKQFYTLSKKHHPDLHPNDSTAASRFTKISEAYHILGNAALRTKYDRSIAPASTSTSAPQGSHSSHSAHAGSRPASGLSRRRTQFRGPPPSFFRNGGWGAQSAKRAEHASGSKEGAEQGAGFAGSAEPGVGPGGFTQGWDNDVPHFDRAGHFRTQEEIQRGMHGRRVKRTWVPRSEQDVDVQAGGGGVVSGFLAIMGVLGVVSITATMLGGQKTNDPLDRRKREVS